MSGATWIVTLVALGVRAILWVMRPGLTYDGTYYLRQAERFLHGEFQVVGFPPGYPAAVALVRLAVGEFELAGRLVSIGAGTATVALFHIWARRKLPAPWALGTALFLAVHPEIARTSVEILSEPLYIACIVLGFLLFDRRRDFASGALFGFAFLVRPEAVVLILGCALWRAGEARHGGAISMQRCLSAALPVLIGLVPVVLFSAMSTAAVGHWVLTTKQGQLDVDADVWSRLGTVARSWHVLFPLILVPGALVAGWRTRSILLIALLYVLTLPFYSIHIQPRLLQPALPFLLVLGSTWILSLRSAQRRSVLAATAILAVWGAASPAVHLFRPGIVTRYDKSLGAALRPHLRFDDRVACRFPFVPYYAGAGFVSVPIVPYVATMDSLVAMHATHLLVIEHEVIDMVPQLRPLYEDASFATAEGRLTLVTALAPAVGPRALLYRFQPAAIESTLVVDATAVASAWAGSTLLFATRDGTLHARPDPKNPEPAGLSAVHGAQELCVSADGARLGLVLASDGGTELGELDLRHGDLRVFPATANDAPTSPAYVGDALVYVRRTGSGSLGVLDPSRGRVRPVHFRGLGPNEAKPLCVTTRGTDIAITYLRARRERDEHRIVAAALWPEVAPTDTAVVLTGRWATQLSLANDAVAWVAGENRLLCSVAVYEVDEKNQIVGGFSSLAVFTSDGRLRAVSFGIPAPRHPSVGPDRVAFLAADAQLRTASFHAEALAFPEVKVFPAPRPEVQNTRP